MNSALDFASLLLSVFIWLALWLGPFCVVLWLGYYFVSLRLRRQDRARLFLNLIEVGLSQGRRVEETIISISDSRDTSIGIHFHLLAFYIKEGLSFGDALKSVPRLLPAQITAMLIAGLKIGDLNKVLPACRQLGKDAVSQTRGAINYLMLVAFVGFPVNLVLLTVLQIYVFPQIMAVCYGMGVEPPPGLRFLIEYRVLILVFQLLLFFLIWSVALVYIDGPKFFSWLNRLCSPFSHRLFYWLPWRRKRMQRDFSAMLAILIDAGMPEPEAVATAADCTANRIFQRRAARAVAAMQDGMKLTDAVQMVDDSGEFRWRLTNALHAHEGFFKAVAGWNESLDAKAFQQEQATAQAITTGLVLLNGALVGFIVVSVFSILIAVINTGLLW